MKMKENPFLKEATYKQAFFWNMMGSGLNAAASVFMLLITTRIAGENQGGIFSIGFAIASLMWSIASYETNIFHVTDGKNEFKNEDFFHVKLFLCGTAVLISIVYILIRGYDVYKTMVAFLLCLYKIFDAFSGYFYGVFQKSKRLDISGKSYFMRVFLSQIGFCITLMVCKELIGAVLVSCIIELVWIGLYEIPRGRFLLQYRSKPSPKKMVTILKRCFPLFCASFMLMYIINIPKYAIDRIWNEQIQNYFGIIFMPAAIINLFGIFIYRPMLTTMVRYWNDNKVKKLILLCLRCCGMITGVTVVCVLGSYWFGIPLLEFLYGVSLEQYRMALVVVMIAGGFNAGISFLYNILVVARRQVWIIIAYTPSLITALLVVNQLVGRFEVMGASITYLISIGIIFMIMVLVVGRLLGKRVKE